MLLSCMQHDKVQQMRKWPHSYKNPQAGGWLCSMSRATAILSLSGSTQIKQNRALFGGQYGAKHAQGFMNRV